MVVGVLGLRLLLLLLLRLLLLLQHVVRRSRLLAVHRRRVHTAQILPASRLVRCRAQSNMPLIHLSNAVPSAVGLAHNEIKVSKHNAAVLEAV